MKIKPFFSYYGGKWRIAPRYPAPRHSTIIEPFAGSAGYSLRYPDRDVLLVEKYDVLYGIWSYLIRVSEEEILGLPDVPNDTRIDDIPGICQEARWLMGFCVNQATSTPMQTNGAWARSLNGGGMFWTEARRQRIASQLHAIRHWRVMHGSYEDIEVGNPATWFVDPPYQVQGKHYKERDIHYGRLGHWCRTLPGQSIVCEGQDADWLPFEHLIDAAKAPNKHHKNKKSPEMIWTNDQ
jgi:hypothetical protein